MPKKSFHIQSYSNDFAIITAKVPGTLTALGSMLQERQYDFYSEVIVTEMEILIKLNQALTPDQKATILNYDGTSSRTPTVFKLPIYFTEDDDWKQIQNISGLERSNYIKELTSIQLSVAMYGFLPGFTYISGLPGELHIPRKDTPAKHVTAGSIAIGGGYLGTYTVESPGGWHVIGKTPMKILDLEKLPPTPWRAGDVVVIERIDEERYEELLEKKLSIEACNK